MRSFLIFLGLYWWAIYIHDDVIKWKHFPRYWPFMRGIHRSPVNSPYKGQWRGALMFTLICARINGSVNNREADDLRRQRDHYDVSVITVFCVVVPVLGLLSDAKMTGLRAMLSMFVEKDELGKIARIVVYHFNTLRPKQNGRHFADDTFNRIFVNENFRISIKFPLKFVRTGRINNIPALVQIMARRRSCDKTLYEPVMVSLLTHICVTRPQWVNHKSLPF